MDINDLIAKLERSANVTERLLCIDGKDGNGDVFVALDHQGTIRHPVELQNAIEGRKLTPLRRRGDTTAADADSFVRIVNRWRVPNHTTIWADPAQSTLLAIINHHPAGPDGAAWGDFRTHYRAKHSPEWITWSAQAGQELTQEQFSQLIDDNAPDVQLPKQEEPGKYPTQIELLEMARNLSIYTHGVFERKIDPTTGSGTMVVKDEHAQYSTKIWRAFPLALRVFEGGAYYFVEARIKFRVVNGSKALFTYTLYRADEIKRRAFDEIRAIVATGCEGCPVFVGQP